MSNIDFMSSDRLEAFYDAVIAIIVTILVLELPQPETASLAAIWAIKNSYFSYLISFLICTNIWQYHHIIYSHVDKINSKLIWLNIALLFIISLIPYLTIFVANNPFSLLAQVLYGLDFILINFVIMVMGMILVKINPEKNLIDAISFKNALVFPSLVFLAGLIIAFLGYPIAISISCLITLIRSIIFSLK